MVELLVPITMFFVLISGVQRVLNHVDSWRLDSIPGIRRSLSVTPGERLCLGVTQSLLSESRIDSPGADGEHGLVFLVEGNVSDRLTGPSGESFYYRILLGPGAAGFELCTTGTLHAADVIADPAVFQREFL